MSLVFNSLEECQAGASQIFNNIATYWVSIGYIWDDDGIVGKVNGVDQFDAARITKWDDPKPTADSKWYIQNPTGFFPPVFDPLEGVTGYEIYEPVVLPEE